MNHLLFFSGKDCDHCDAMRPLIARLNYEQGVLPEEHEVWGNEANYRLMENYSRAMSCQGIPVFVNTKTGVVLCGEITYKQLVDWATGKIVVQ